MKAKFIFSLMMGGCAVAAMAQGGYQDGVDYYNADRFEKAKTILQNTLNDASTNKAVSFYYLGSLDLREGNLSGAKAYFEKGIAADPATGYNYVGLGEIALKNGNEKEAETYFSDAVKLDKKDYAVKAAIARAYFNVDPVKYAKQIDDNIKKAMKDSKNMGTAVYVLQGDMARAKNEVGPAAGFYEQAITYEEAAGNVNPEAYVKYANLYNKVNNDYSIAKLVELNDKLPNSALAQSELAEKYYDSELFSKAAAQYAKYMKNPNHFQQDEQRYSLLLFFDKKYPESLAIAKDVLKKDPSNHYMYRMVLVNDDALENYEEAAEYGAKLFNAGDVTLTNNDCVTYGRALQKLGRNEEAADVYLRAYNNDPQKNEGMLVNLSDLYSELGDYKKSAEYLQKYVDGGNASLTDVFALAKLYGATAQQAATPEERDADIANGVKYIDMALERASNKASLHRTKAQMLTLRDGDKLSQELADTYLTMLAAYEEENPTAIQDNPGIFKQAYSVLGAYYQQQKDQAESLKWFEKLYELDPTIPGLKQMLKK
ncbi:MAG: tetratricopeptide repeat protein [Bacteroides sp.]|nr:tetratricopeptide repeat protein [Bacteroides sp.]MBD5376366.1 tetratricopeptide repeat protein [Bacteroides sp.]